MGIVVSASRLAITNRFPTVVFVVETRPEALFEIVCTTDAELLRPENRARRTAENFYSTRQHGWLRAAAGRTSVGLSTEAVLSLFRAGTVVHYAAAVFPEGDLAGPELSVDPREHAKIPCLSCEAGFARRAQKFGGAMSKNPATKDLTWGGDVIVATPPDAASEPQATGDSGVTSDMPSADDGGLSSASPVQPVSTEGAKTSRIEDDHADRRDSTATGAGADKTEDHRNHRGDDTAASGSGTSVRAPDKKDPSSHADERPKDGAGMGSHEKVQKAGDDSRRVVDAVPGASKSSDSVTDRTDKPSDHRGDPRPRLDAATVAKEDDTRRDGGSGAKRASGTPDLRAADEGKPKALPADSARRPAPRDAERAVEQPVAASPVRARVPVADFLAALPRSPDVPEMRILANPRGPVPNLEDLYRRARPSGVEGGHATPEGLVETLGDTEKAPRDTGDSGATAVAPLAGAESPAGAEPPDGAEPALEAKEPPAGDGGATPVRAEDGSSVAGTTGDATSASPAVAAGEDDLAGLEHGLNEDPAVAAPSVAGELGALALVRMVVSLDPVVLFEGVSALAKAVGRSTERDVAALLNAVVACGVAAVKQKMDESPGEDIAAQVLGAARSEWVKTTSLLTDIAVLQPGDVAKPSHHGDEPS